MASYRKRLRRPGEKKNPGKGTGRSYSLTLHDIPAHLGIIVDASKPYMGLFRKYGISQKEVIQLSVVGVLERIPVYNSEYSVGTFIPVVVKSTLIDYLRVLRRNKAKGLDDLETVAHRRAMWTAREMDASESAAHSDVWANLVRLAPTVLNPRLHLFFQLSVVHGLPNAEVARIMNVSPLNVNTYNNQMKKALRSSASIQALVDPSISKKRRSEKKVTD